MKFPELAFDADAPPRERILLAAHTLFYVDGIRATGVDKVIEKAGVSKVTFYRQYASKDDLTKAYLDFRHSRWLNWFEASMEEGVVAGQSASQALVGSLEDWFTEPSFRGCAFLNAAAELGSSDPQILEIVRAHKRAMSSVLDRFFVADAEPAGEPLALLIDGSIVHAQMGRPIAEVLEGLRRAIDALVCA